MKTTRWKTKNQGNLIHSTVLNLLVMPSLALRYGRFASGIGR